MKRKTYLTVVTIIFTVIAIVHIVRALRGWEAVIGGFSLPVWVSWVGVVIAGYLALKGGKLLREEI